MLQCCCRRANEFQWLDFIVNNCNMLQYIAICTITTEPIWPRISNETNAAEQLFNCCRRRHWCVNYLTDCWDSQFTQFCQIRHKWIFNFVVYKFIKMPEIWFKIKIGCYKMTQKPNSSKNDVKLVDVRSNPTVCSLLFHEWFRPELLQPLDCAVVTSSTDLSHCGLWLDTAWPRWCKKQRWI